MSGIKTHTQPNGDVCVCVKKIYILAVCFRIDTEFNLSMCHLRMCHTQTALFHLVYVNG